MAGDSVERMLENVRMAGALQSEGTFTVDLAEAALKMSQFGQVDASVWLLSLGRAFHRLGCSALEIRLLTSGWIFRGRQPRSSVDQEKLQRALVRFGFEEESSPEREIAVAVCALAALPDAGQRPLAAWWTEADKLIPLLGSGHQRQALGEGECALTLRFAGKIPDGLLPRILWRDRFAFSPLAISFATGHDSLSALNGHGGLFEAGEPWLEYRVDPEEPALVTLGGASARMALATVSSGDDSVYARWAWRQTAEDTRGSVVVYVQAGKQNTVVHPVRAGCLLEPFRASSLPGGFRVVVDAGDCPTDISGMALREGPEKSALMSGLQRPLMLATAKLLELLESDQPLELAGAGLSYGQIPPQAGLIFGTMLAAALPDWRVALGVTIGGFLGLPPLLHRLTRKSRLARGEAEKALALDEFRARLRDLE